MNPTIVRLARAALIGQRRFWALLAVPLLLCAVALVLGLTSGEADTGWELVRSIWIPLVVPLVALLAASSVLGPEIDDGSIVYLLAKPVSRHTVVRSKYVVAAAAAVALGLVPLLVLGLLMPSSAGARPGDLALALGVGSVVSALAYVALFLALSASLSRSVSAAVIYVFVWEQTVGSLLSGARTLSVGAWGERVAAEVTVLPSAPDFVLWWAVLATIVTVVVGLWWAGDRMRSFTLRNDG